MHLVVGARVRAYGDRSRPVGGDGDREAGLDEGRNYAGAGFERECLRIGGAHERAGESAQRPVVGRNRSDRQNGSSTPPWVVCARCSKKRAMQRTRSLFLRAIMAATS